jgi:hypothetical protein
VGTQHAAPLVDKNYSLVLMPESNVQMKKVPSFYRKTSVPRLSKVV